MVYSMFLKLKMLRTFSKLGDKIMHSDTICNDVSEVGTAERKLKAKRQNGSFWHYMKRWCWQLDMLRKLWKQGRLMMYSDAFWTMLWKLLKMLKARGINGAFWRYLKRCFRSWNCLENVESKEAKWCILIFPEECGDDFQGSYWM